MMNFLVNLFDKLRGTRQYRITLRFDRHVDSVQVFGTYKEALEFWNASEDINFRSMTMERINKHGAHVRLMCIKW